MVEFGFWLSGVACAVGVFFLWALCSGKDKKHPRQWEEEPEDDDEWMPPVL